MSQRNLQGLRVAILVTNDFEQVEMTKPAEALQGAGAETTLIAPALPVYVGQFMVARAAQGQVQSMNHDVIAEKFPVDLALEDADPNDFDALLLPGGAMNADQLRLNVVAQDFAREFDDAEKPIAVICHAAWLLVSAGLVNGRTLTSWPTLQDDIRNAGGNWVDQEVAEDDNWVTSRGPQDIPAFNNAMIRLFSQGVQQMRRAA